MQFSPRFDRGKKQFKTVVWLDLSKVGSVRTQVAKQRCVIGRDSLSNHCNPEPAHWNRFDGNRSLKAILADDAKRRKLGAQRVDQRFVATDHAAIVAGVASRCTARAAA